MVRDLRKFPGWLAMVWLAMAAAQAEAPPAAPGYVALDGATVSWLRDAEGNLSVDQAAARNSAFQPLSDGNLSRGYTREVIWLRLSLPVFAAQAPRWLDVPPAILDDVRLYIPNRPPVRGAGWSGGWLEQRAGDHLPFAARGPYRTAAFPLPVLAEGTVLYVRIQTTSIMAAEPRLWDGAALRQSKDLGTAGDGIYLGLMGAVAMFSLVGWFLTRQYMYGVFAVFVSAIAVRWCMLDGTIAQYLFPYDPSPSFQVTTALLGLCGTTGALCQIWLLQLRWHARGVGLLRFYQCAALLGLLVMCTPLIGYTAPLASAFFAMMLVAPLLSVGAYARLWRSGNPGSRLLAVVMPLHYLVMFPSNLSILALHPFTVWSLQVAHLSELGLVLALHATIVLRGRDAERERNTARRAAIEAQAASQRERVAREEQAQFLAMITHEVRTPVALIDAAAHSLRLLDADGADPALRGSRYTNIRNAVGRMKALMELAEMHGRLAPGEQAYLAVPFDLRGLTGDVVNALDPQAATRVAVEEGGDALPPLLGDTRLLYFSLLNLLDNALKYADPGTPIRVGIAAEKGGVAWRIGDQGRGVPSDMAEAIFEKYHRLDEAANQPGLGLGLPLARQIVERHGGHLRLDLAWRGGAGFVIWLPKAA